MKTIRIDHLRTEELEDFQSDIIDSGDSKEAALARIEDLEARFRFGVEGVIDLNAVPLSDEEGTQYDRISFTILSSYTLGGDLWLSGNEFKLNLTHYFAEIRELAESAYPSIERPAESS